MFLIRVKVHSTQTYRAGQYVPGSHHASASVYNKVRLSVYNCGKCVTLPVRSLQVKDLFCRFRRSVGALHWYALQNTISVVPNQLFMLSHSQSKGH